MIRPKRSYRHNQPTTQVAGKFRNVLRDRIDIAHIDHAQLHRSRCRRLDCSELADSSGDSGRAGTMTHDYKRNGTTTLFAALNMLDGKVIGTCMPRHRHREFLRFLKLIDQQTPGDLDLHLIVDNYATHKTPAVKRWLKAHPRFHLHFTPTSASWLNMVERFFAEITRNRIRRGTFKSVPELKAAIMDYLENHNVDPKLFIWTKSAGEILEKVARAKQALESQH
jgi:transposase